MPDLSLFIPLCSILNISVNELINGEKLNNNMENFQENVIKTMVYSHNKTHKAFKILIIFIFVIIFSFILFQKKVLDSYKESSNILDNMFYYENTNITIIKKIIRKSLLSNKPKKDIITIQYEGETDSVTKEVTLDNFASFKIFKIEETKNEEINVYLIALVGSYYQDDISIYEIYSQSLQFYKYTLKKNDTSYEIVDIITTEEKEKLSEYDNFFQTYFPKDVTAYIKKYYKTHIYKDLYFDHWNMVNTFYNNY